MTIIIKGVGVEAWNVNEATTPVQPPSQFMRSNI